jgi:hypothetical protein
MNPFLPVCQQMKQMKLFQLHMLLFRLNYWDRVCIQNSRNIKIVEDSLWNPGEQPRTIFKDSRNPL